MEEVDYNTARHDLIQKKLMKAHCRPSAWQHCSDALRVVFHVEEVELLHDAGHGPRLGLGLREVWRHDEQHGVHSEAHPGLLGLCVVHTGNGQTKTWFTAMSSVHTATYMQPYVHYMRVTHRGELHLEAVPLVHVVPEGHVHEVPPVLHGGHAHGLEGVRQLGLGDVHAEHALAERLNDVLGGPLVVLVGQHMRLRVGQYSALGGHDVAWVTSVRQMYGAINCVRKCPQTDHCGVASVMVSHGGALVPNARHSERGDGMCGVAGCRLAVFCCVYLALPNK